MAAIVSGNGLGLFTSSLGVLGAGVGNAGIGRAGEGAYVNAASGNLIVQRQDEVLLGRGPDLSLVRTYNSQGQLTDDNGDNWLLGIQKRLSSLTGTINTAGSTVTRSNGDGAELVYSYDAVRGLYVNKDGAGSFDTLSYNAGVWTWTDGSSQLTETYDWNAGAGKLLSITDADGNALTYSYTGNLLTLVTDASGEQTYLDYSGNNLTQIRTVRADSTQLTRTRYGYDSSNRLTSVTVDLTPDDNSIADGKTYVTSYTYDGTSRRIASITQTDGSQIAFTYATQTDGSVRVTQVSQTVSGANRITYLTYDLANRKTTVTDPAGNATLYTYDTQGRLIQLQGPAVAGVSQLISYAYDADGNVTQQTDALGNTVTSQFDANGNMILQRDALGNTVTRTYDSKNNLLTQTAYLTPDPDGAGSAQPSAPQTSRFAYDANGHLRFTVSAAGRVTEYRYNAQGQLVTSVSYTANAYNLTGLTATDTIAGAALTAWAAGVDQTGTTRSDMTYDFRGQVSSTTNYAKVDAAGAGISDGTQATTAYVYDQAGQLLKTVAAKGVATTGNATDFVTTYSYDGLGRMLSTTDSLNRTTVSQYDDAGNKTITTLANGLATTSAYNQAGELISVLQSDGATALGETKYWYDADGRVRMTQDPTGVKSYCLYDAAGRKIAAIDGNGSLVEYVYNANNQLISSKAYATAVSAANLAALVDGAGNPSNVTLASIRPATNSADRTSWNLYDAASRLVKTIDAEGYVSQNLYDGAGRVTDTVRYATAVNLAAITSATQASDAAATPAASAADRHSRTFYDADGKAVAALDAAGYLTESQYDAAGRLIHTIGYATQTSAAQWSNGTLNQLRPATTSQDTHGWVLYDGRGNVIATVNAEGYLTESVYDANGNQTQHIAYANKALIAPELVTAGTRIGSLRPAASSADQVTSSTYTDTNQVDTSTNVQGSVTRYTYDTAGNLIQTDKAFATAEVRTLQARYDRQGRVTGELTAEGSAALAALTAPTQAQIDAIWTSYGVTHTYDAAGRRTSTTDAAGSKTLFYYNADGQLTTTINALGEVKQSVYNALNELSQTVVYGLRIGSTALATLTGGLENATLAAAIAAISNILPDSKTSVAYDHRGQVASSTDELGNVSSVTYNAFGQALSATTQVAAGSTVTTQYQYDNRGLTTGTTQDAGGLNLITQALYDAFGRTTQTIDANGNVQSRQYDRLGRAVQSTDALNIHRSITYDAFDRTLTQTDGNGNVTTTSYNDANRSVTITTAEGISVATVKNRHGETVQVTDGNGNATSYTYDKNGNLKSTTDALGHTTAASYDHAGRVIETTDANGVKTASSYDAASRLLTRTLDPGGLNLITTYSYDAKGQTATVTDAAGVLTQTAYDAKGQVVSTTLDPSGLNLKTTYSYDARGKTLTVTDAAGSASQRTTQYTYDKLGRRTKEQIDPAGLNITTQYAYDANDNLVRKTDANGNVTRLVYDSENRLVFAVNPTGGVTKNTYDNAGNLTATTAYAQPINVTALPASPSVADVAAALAAVYLPTPVSQAIINGVTVSQPGVIKDVKTALNRSAYLYTNGDLYVSTGSAAAVKVASNVDKFVMSDTRIAILQGTSISMQDDAVGPAFTVYGNGVDFQMTNSRIGILQQQGGTLRVTAFANGAQDVINYVVKFELSDTRLAILQGTTVSVHDYSVPSPYWTEYGTGVDFQMTNSRLGVLQQNGTLRITTFSGGALDIVNYVVKFVLSDTRLAILQGTTLSVHDYAVPSPYWTEYGSNVVNFKMSSSTMTLLKQDGSLHVTNPVFLSGASQVAQDVTDFKLGGNITVYTKTVGPDSASDRTMRHVYDADGREVYSVDSLNQVSKKVYDAHGNVIETIAYANAIPATTGMTATGIGAALTPSVNDRHTRAAYDAANRLVYGIDAQGAVTKNEYDAAGQVVRTVAYATPVSLTGQPTAAQVAAAVTVDALDRSTRNVFDHAGRVVYVIDAAGFVKETQYDAASRIVKTIQYAQAINVGNTPTVLEVAAALHADLVTATTANQVNSYLTDPVQPYAYSGAATVDTTAPATQTVQVGNAASNITADPIQPYTYAASANTDVATAATQSVQVDTQITQIPADQPVQPYTYVASAMADTATTQTQNISLQIINTSQTQSASVADYAWARSGYSLYTTSGTSLKPGTVPFGDGTPTMVRTTLFRDLGNGQTEWYNSLYTDVGWVSQEAWDAGGYMTSAPYMNSVSGWTGQVNLSTGSQLPPGKYLVVVETRDDAVAMRAPGVFFDWTDSTWAYTTNVYFTVGTFVNPTVVKWAASTQPAGTTASFSYRTAGSTGAYTSAAVTVSGTDQQVSLAGLAAGNYEYKINYTDSYGRVVKSAAGTMGVSTGVTSSATAAFNYTQVASAASAGSSISGYIAAADVPAIEYVDAVVTDRISGAVISTARTYPEFEANYNGNVNLKVGAELATGSYTVAITVKKKDGTTVVKPTFTYEVGLQSFIRDTISWAASTQPAGTTASFGYRAAGSTGAFTSATIGTSGANQQVVLDRLPVGNYEYQLQYKDSYNRIIKSAAATFTVAASGSTSTATSFSYTQVTSTPGAGSAISGYIALAEVPAIARITATVRDQATNAVVSTAETYPEFEANYNGNVNLKTGSALADGRYKVDVTIYYKDGTSVNKPTFNYEVGPQQTWHPVQPYTYVAAAKSDVSTVQTQNVALQIVNTSQINSANLASNSWYRSGNSIYQTTGMSIASGYVAYGDATPTYVKATMYKDGAYYNTVYTDVGYNSTESWSQYWYTDSSNEYGPPQDYYLYYSATKFNGVNNWSGQVNLTGAMTAGAYTIVVETGDEAAAARTPNGYFDGDGTWAYSTTVNVVVGPIITPTVVSWPASTQPAGTTVSFGYRTAGSTGAYTSATVGASGSNQQVSLAGLAAGNYDYQISYTDSYGRVVKSAAGTFGTSTGVTTSATAAFNYAQVTSTVAAGSSISGYIAAADVPAIDYIDAVVTDRISGAVISTARTYPGAEANYNGEVNLKVGAQLADGSYTVAITVKNKNGSTVVKPAFTYELGFQTRIRETISWAAATQPAGTTGSFGYRIAGSNSGYTNAAISTVNGNQQVAIDLLPPGNYEYQIQYTDSYNRVIKSAASTFTVAAGGSSTTAASFSYTQVTSTTGAGSSISGYIAPAEVPTIDHVVATVRNAATNAVVSTADTYPEFEANYNGNVNLKTGSALADGRYKVDIAVYYKDGSVVNKPGFDYEIGMQQHHDQITTVSWSLGNQPANSTARFTYAPAGSAVYVEAPIAFANGQASISLTNLAAGSYQYYVRYLDNTTNQWVKEAIGQFVAGGVDVTMAGLSFHGTTPIADQINTFAYDAAGRLIQSVDAEGFTEAYGYDSLGNKTSFTNKKGSVWTYDYDANARLVAEHSPTVAVTNVSAGLAVTAENVSLVTHMTYDAMGNVASRTEAYGRPEARTTYYQYDAAGHQVKTIYPTTAIYNPGIDNLSINGTNGAVTRTESTVDLSSTVTYDTLGNAVASLDAAGNYSYKVYDNLGRVKYEIDAERFVTEYAYDAFGGQVQLTRHANRIDTAGHGNPALPFTRVEVAALLGAPAAGDRTIQTQYNNLGQAVQVIQPQVFTYDSSAAAGSQYFTAGETTKSQYNAYGQLIKQSVLHNALTDTWADTIYYYDARGNKIAQVDPLGYLTTWSYDAENNVTGQIEYARALTAGSWNTIGHAAPLITTYLTSPDAASGYDRESRFGYDRKNQKITETQVNVEYGTAVGTLGVVKTHGDLTTSLAYDGVGNLVQTTDSAGTKTYMYYDMLGRNRAVANPAGSGQLGLTTFDHDAYGNVTRQVRWANGTVAADANNYAAAAGDAANDQVAYNRYDSHGHLIQSVDAEGKSKFTSYDAMGRVAKEWQPITDNDGIVQNSMRIYQYDKLGQQTATVDPSYLPNQAFGIASTPAAITSRSLSYTTGYRNAPFTSYDIDGVPFTSSVPALHLIYSWSPTALLGDGDVRVEYDYYRGAYDVPGDPEYNIGGYTVPAAVETFSQTFSAAEADTGVAMLAVMVPGMSAPATNPQATRVYKKDAAGNWRLIRNSVPGGADGTIVSFTPPLQPGDTVSLYYRPYAGGAWSAAPLYAMGKQYIFDTSALPSNAYYFEIVYTRPGDQNPSTHQTGYFGINPASGYIFNGETYVSIYSAPAINPSTSTAITQAQYNAFGEIVAKGVNGWQEYFDYDNAGHMWRTNGQDGVDKVYLYDLAGKSTAEIRSQQRDLHDSSLYPTAQSAAGLTANVMRNETVYDLKEQAVKQIQASFTVNRSLEVSTIPLEYPQATLSYTPTTVMNEIPAPEGGTMLAPMPALDVSWNAMSGWGPGAVRLEIDYYTQPYTYTDDFGPHSGGGASHISFDVAGSIDHVVVPAAAQQYITAIRLYKTDASGISRLVRSGPGFGASTNQLILPHPPEMGGRVQFNVRPVGGAGWTSLPLIDFGLKSQVDLSGLANGAYDYEVLYFHKNPNGTGAQSTPYSHATGNFSVNGPSGWLTQSTVPGTDAFATITPVTNQTFDRWGNVLSVSNANDGFAVTKYRYNYLSKVIQETKPFADVYGVDGSKSQVAPVSQYYFDKVGRTIATTDANGYGNAVRYNDAGQIVAEYHADGGAVYYSFDLLGRKSNTTDATGNVTSYTYDRLNRLLSEQHPIGIDRFYYDEAGNRIRHINANGESDYSWYDTRGKLIRTRLAMGQETNLYYDLRGNKVKELNANSDKLTFSYDYFGRMQSRTDMSGVVYSFIYNEAGALSYQTSTRGQSLSQNYYENGSLKTITDFALNAETFYEYDAAGNRTRERFTKGGVTHQDNRISFDNLGRITSVQDNRYSLDYGYDAVGNRRFTKSFYFANNGEAKNVENWYLYDGMNRITLSQGVLAGGVGGSIQINVNQGIQLSYDASGDRRASYTLAGGTLHEDYNYDGNHRLGSTYKNGALSSVRTYDAVGRVVAQENSIGTGNYQRLVSVYNANGWLRQQDTSRPSGSGNSHTVYEYDNAGNVANYTMSVSGGFSYTNTYRYQYAAFDSYKELVVRGTSTYFQAGDTVSDYDQNGNLVSITDHFDANKYRSFVNDQAGHVLNKTESGVTQYYFYVGDKPSGTTGGNGTADFDFNYTPISSQYPASTPSAYVVNSGDTLRSIAATVYGDAQLWYLIADANGLQADGDLKIGKSLTIPNRITNLHNDFQTFKPYAPGAIIGDTMPTLPDPPPPPKEGGGCGGIGMIIMIIVMIVATILTAGAAAAAFGAVLPAGTVGVWASGVAVLGGAGGMAGFAAAVVGGAMGSLIGQSAGVVMGIQKEISWSGVAMGAISAGVGAGLGEMTALGKVGTFTNTVGRAVVSNVVTQGISVAVGLQDSFSWRSVAASAVGAGVSWGIGQAVGEAQYDSAEGFKNADTRADWGKTFMREAVSGLGSGIARQLVTTGKVEWKSVAADAFGNAVANAIVNASVNESREEQRKNAEELQRSRLFALPIVSGKVGLTFPEGAAESLYRMPDFDNKYEFPKFDYSLVGDREVKLSMIDPYEKGQESEDLANKPKESGRRPLAPEQKAAMAARARASANGTLFSDGDGMLSSKKLSMLGARFDNAWDLEGLEIYRMFKIEGAGSVHEQITRQAALNAGIKFDNGLNQGSAWPDVPCPGDAVETCYVGTRRDLYKPGTLANRSHYGSLQFWHSMAYEDGLTNEQVSARIIRQAVAWYQLAIDQNSTFNIGKLLHMVQDSYSMSHVVRDLKGRVVLFQSYSDQNPDKHGHADEIGPGMKSWRDVPGALPALAASTRILELFRERAPVSMLVKYLTENVYQFAPSAAKRAAGGTAPEFSNGRSASGRIRT